MSASALVLHRLVLCYLVFFFFFFFLIFSLYKGTTSTRLFSIVWFFKILVLFDFVIGMEMNKLQLKMETFGSLEKERNH